MLDVNKLTVVRDERVLFDSLSFSIDTGEIVQIEGRNGAGKTTLLRAIAGLSDCDAGEVLWNKEPIKVARDSYYSELIFFRSSNRY